jgi:hypothetical protein
MKNIHQIGKNIYITNDEAIKEGDWVIKISSLYKGGGIAQKYSFMNAIYSFIDAQFEDIIFKKVIITTDQNLIADGIQAIDDEFLQWFVKNSNCESVDVVKCRGYLHLSYMIMIPQEEPKQEPKNTCPKCRTTDFDDCHSIKCPMRKEEPKQEWLKNAKWGVRLTKDNQPDFTYVDQWFEGKLLKRDMLKLVYPDSPSFSYSSWKVFDTKELAEEWIKVPQEEPKQDNNFYEKLKQYFEETPREKVLEDWAKSTKYDKVSPTVDDFLNNINKQRANLQSLESELDEVLSKETEESLTTRLNEKRSKQETLDEASRKNALIELEKYAPNKERFKLSCKNSFLRGAKFLQEQETRVFGTKEDKSFWSDKPIQDGNPNKQETLEEAGVAYAKTVNENHTSHMLGFYNGAKWQAEQDKHSEDVLKMCWAAASAYTIGSHKDFKQTHPDFKEWFEQYKIK